MIKCFVFSNELNIAGFTEYLTDNNIHVSVRGTNTVRVTPHLWINDNDIDRFVSVVKTYFKK